MDLDAVDPVDKAAPFTTASWSGREDDNLMPATDQTRRKVMDLHLDSTQAGQITVRQYGDLHGTQPRMRQDRT